MNKIILSSEVIEYRFYHFRFQIMKHVRLCRKKNIKNQPHLTQR